MMPKLSYDELEAIVTVQREIIRSLATLERRRNAVGCGLVSRPNVPLAEMEFRDYVTMRNAGADNIEDAPDEPMIIEE